MFRFIRQLLLASLTIILIGGVFTPALVQAASTNADSSEATLTSTRYQFTAFNYPYNLITDEQGKTTQVPLYPDADAQSVTVDQINATPDFLDLFPLGGTKDNSSYNVAQRMTSLTDPTGLVNDDDSLATFRSLYSPIWDINDPDTLITFLSNYDYVFTWLFKIGAQIERSQTDYDTVYKDYLQNVLPRAIAIDAVREDMGLVNTIGGPKDQPAGMLANAATLTSSAPKMVQAAATEFHLTEPTARLANLDPEGSALKEEALLKQPVKDFILIPTKESGESSKNNESVSNIVTAVADGQLITDVNPTCFVFKKPSAPVVNSQDGQPVTIHYVDEHGNTLKPDKTLTGSLGDTYKTEPLSINGYTLVKTTGQETGTYTSSDQSVTYTYRKDTVNSIIYATKKLGLYSSPTFTKKALKATYANKSRMNRPIFKVIGTATSKTGAKRYQVQDLNGKGTTGYVTAKVGYTAPLYYAKRQSQITVINPNGLNAYSNKSLTSKATHYKQDQVLKVKKIVTHNLTTRFVLSNGTYISANKKLVIAGKYTMPKRVQAKMAVNRYDTANLTNRNRHYPRKAHATFTVKGWAYSNANNFRKGDTLRYKVAGGYITGNKQFVRVIH